MTVLGNDNPWEENVVVKSPANPKTRSQSGMLVCCSSCVLRFTKTNPAATSVIN